MIASRVTERPLLPIPAIDHVLNLFTTEPRRLRFFQVGLQGSERGCCRGNATWRNIEFRHPCNTIEHKCAKIIIGPMPVPVAAGAGKPSSPIWPYSCPSQDFRHALARPNRRIATVWAVGAVSRTVGRNRRQNRRHALHVIDKPHVVVPLVINGKRPDTPGDGMRGQLLEIGCPTRVN